ncbi:MAG: hypothetical protein PHP56_10475 [Smithellaceae bacterium]|nr:hypothetical protein [Smithellaceae bacterium]MDD3260077.1 hypothetical protein [Smithellaceae bacterium]
MYTNELKQSIRQSSLEYAREHGFDVDSSPKSAVIFKNLSDTFHPASFDAIKKNIDWFARLDKHHQNISNIKEMQSSNSSDALLMNIFCHPKLATWEGVADILGFYPLKPTFGEKPKIYKEGTDGDMTEIDMSLCDTFVEAKLTEEDFTDKDISEVLKYKNFKMHFHVDYLPIHNNRYQNYQVIRNLLAAIQHKKRHILLCDERRPDLARCYMETVCCLKDPHNRKNCRVIFWQEIKRACGDDLGSFLCSRYGIC